MEEKFDYAKAVSELEEIARKAEDSSFNIDDIEGYIRRSDELIAACRAYLRGARQSLGSMGGDVQSVDA